MFIFLSFIGLFDKWYLATLALYYNRSGNYSKHSVVRIRGEGVAYEALMTYLICSSVYWIYFYCGVDHTFQEGVGAEPHYQRCMGGASLQGTNLFALTLAINSLFKCTSSKLQSMSGKYHNKKTSLYIKELIKYSFGASYTTFTPLRPTALFLL